MADRYLTVVKANNEIKVAQYGHVGAYPSEAGCEILFYLKNMNLEILKEKVAKCKWTTQEEVEKISESFLQSGDKDSGYYNRKRDFMLWRFYPQYHHHVGARVLQVIYANQSTELENDLDFAKEYLCEWAYVIDLDEMKLETYCSYGDIKTLDIENQVLSKDSAVKLVRVDDIATLPDANEYALNLEVEIVGIGEEAVKRELEYVIEDYCSIPNPTGDEVVEVSEEELRLADADFEIEWEKERAEFEAFKMQLFGEGGIENAELILKRA